MSKVLCVGGALKDIFFPTNEGVVENTPDDMLSTRKVAFELGAKYYVDTRYESVGGCAANVAVGLAKLDIAAAAYCTLGDDDTGKSIVETLWAAGVDTALCELQPKKTSGVSALVVDESTGDRVIFVSKGTRDGLVVDEKRLDGYPWIFLGHLHGHWQKNFKTILSVTEKQNFKIAYNPGQGNIKEDCALVCEMIKKTDLLFVNKDEATEIVTKLGGEYNEDALSDACFLIEKLHNCGAQTVVITDGAHGAWASDGTACYQSPAADERAKDTTGAGDAFSSGFFAAQLAGKNLAESLQWGSANAHSVMRQFGAQPGLLSTDDMEEYAGAITAEKIEKS